MQIEQAFLSVHQDHVMAYSVSSVVRFVLQREQITISDFTGLESGRECFLDNGLYKSATYPAITMLPAPLLYLLVVGSVQIAGRLNYARTMRFSTFDLTFLQLCHLNSTKNTPSYLRTYTRFSYRPSDLISRSYWG